MASLWVEPPPDILGPIDYDRVVFCLDSSASMAALVPLLRDQLKEALTSLMFRPGARFNLLDFGGTGNEFLWSERLTPAHSDMVSAAHEWIDAIRPRKSEGKASEEPRLVEAFNVACDDDNSQAIYVLTNTVPSGDAEKALDEMIEAADGRPVHAIYLCEERPRRRVFDFFADLAAATAGCVRCFVLVRSGVQSELCPVRCDRGLVFQRSNKEITRVSEPRCSIATSLSAADPVEEWRRVFRGGLQWLHAWRLGAWDQVLAPPKEVLALGERFQRDRLLMAHGSEAGTDLLVGRQVLARKAQGGGFFRGTVSKKIGLHDFLVQFLGPGEAPADAFETVHLSDIIDIDDAMRNSVTAGDHVLAPRGQSERSVFEPALVKAGFERREGRSPSPDAPLVVLFGDGEEAEVPTGLAVWLPKSLYARCLTELGATAEVRARVRGLLSDPGDRPPYSLEDHLLLPPATWRLSRAGYPPVPVWPPPPPLPPPAALCLPPPAALQPALPPLPDERYNAQGPRPWTEGVVRDVRARSCHSASSIEAAARESPQIVEVPTSARKDSTEKGEEAADELQFLVDSPHPFEERCPAQCPVTAFGDTGDPVALQRPPLREAPRKAPWRYWASMRIPQVTDGPSWEPYNDPAAIFGRPFAMTADVAPRPQKSSQLHPSSSCPLNAALSPSRDLPEPSQAGDRFVLPQRLPRDLARECRLHSELNRAALAQDQRSSEGRGRVRAERRERLLNDRLDHLYERFLPGAERTQTAQPQQPFDSIVKDSLAERRHGEMSRSQIRLKARF